MESLSPLRDGVPPSPVKPEDSPFTKGRKKKRANLLRRLQLVEKPYPAEDVESSKTSVTRVVAKWKFEARSKKELSLEPGDVVVVTLQDDASTGWWQGTLKGKDGMFPVNYVNVYEVLMPRRIKIDQKKVSRNIRKLQKQISSGKVLQELNQLDASPQKMPTPLRDLPTESLVEKSPAGRKRRRNVSVKLASNMGYNSPQVIRRRTRSFKSPSRDAANTITRGSVTTPLRASTGVSTSAVSSMTQETKASDTSSRDVTAVGQESSSNDGDSAEAPAKISSIESRRAARKKRLELMRQEAEAEKQRAAERGDPSEDTENDEETGSTSSEDSSDSSSESSSSDESNSTESSEGSSDSGGGSGSEEA